MRVAAGVVLIIIAITNFFGGAAYTLGGSAAVVIAGAGQEINAEIKEDSVSVSGTEGESSTVTVSTTAANGESTEVTHETIDADLQGVKKGGVSFIALGLFQLVLGGLEIAAAVLLFKASKAKFITTVCGLEFVCILLVCLVFGSAPGIASMLGAIGAVLGLIAAAGIAKTATIDEAEYA